MHADCCIKAQARHKLDDVSHASQELREAVALLECLLVCEPTLALELPRLQLGPTSVDVLTLLARVLDAAAALEHPDLHVLGAHTDRAGLVVSPAADTLHACWTKTLRIEHVHESM